MHSLNPLNSGGLWLPVTITPPSAPNRKMEKYRRGVGQIPTSTTCIPADRIPSTRASRKEGEESRQSRPTMRDFPPSRAAYVPNPFPMETTVSGVRSSPTLPRMSYSRNIRGLTTPPPLREVDFRVRPGGPAGDLGAMRRPRHLARDGRRHLPVEHRRYDGIFRQLLLAHAGGDRMRRRQLHLLVDAGGTRVERPAEDPREDQGVVDLVRVVRPSRRHDPDVGGGILGLDLGVRVGHREDDGVLGHLLEVIHRDEAGACEPQEKIGALHDVGEFPPLVRRIGVFGIPVLHEVHMLLAPFVDRADAIHADDVADPRVHEDLAARHARGADAGHHHLQILHPLLDDLQGVEQRGEASTPANSLKSNAFPSMTGIAASGPMSPSPSTAVPSETTATVFLRIVNVNDFLTSFAIAMQTRATPGV